jgi:hypothetical protein
MAEIGMKPEVLLEALLELADRAKLEVRVLSAASAAAEFSPTGSAACRVGDRIWVVLAPDDPPMNQAEVLAGALSRYRADFLETSFVAPGVRDFVEGLGG